NDNAEERLVRKAYEHGLVGADALARLDAREDAKERARELLETLRSPPHGNKTLFEALMRPEVRVADLALMHPELAALALDRDGERAKSDRDPERAQRDTRAP